MQEDIRKNLEAAARRLKTVPSEPPKFPVVFSSSRAGISHRSRRLTVVSLSAALVAIVVVTLIGSSMWRKSSAASPIPSQYSSGLSFPLYFPTSLPSGYRVDESSFQRQDAVLIFNVVSPAGKTLAVSEEASPTTAPSRGSANAPVAIAGERSFSSPAGQTHIGLWGDKYVADIMADRTWIIINGTGFTADQLTPIANSFHKL